MTTSRDPLVTTAPVDEVVAAIESVDLTAPWEQVAHMARLALPRRRPMPVPTNDLPTREFPPGIVTSLGLDIGPAMLFVTREQLGTWNVTCDDAFDAALDNVRSLVAARTRFTLAHERIGDVPTLAFQSGEGWASDLLLLPLELTRVFGETTGLILAPMRDLVMHLPLAVDRRFTGWLLEEFAAIDANALAVPPLTLVDGRLSMAFDIPAIGRSAGVTH